MAESSSLMSKIGRGMSMSSRPGSSFDEVHRDLLWARVKKSFAIALAIALIMVVAIFTVVPMEPLLDTEFANTGRHVLWGHPISFAVALGLLFAIRRRACRMKLQVLAFVVFGANIFMALFNQGTLRPGQTPAFAMAVMLFVPAAFIPWRTGYQVGLGLIALGSFLGINVTQFLGSEQLQEYWYTVPHAHSFGTWLLMESLGIFSLAGVSAAISRTLYSYSKTNHQMKRLGSYEVLEEIGRGGMGRVLKARHHMICRPAAVKLLEAPGADAATAMARFEREVHLSASLTHPNTIQIYDFGRTATNRFFYAMEYLSGMDLDRLVQKYGPLPPERIVFLLQQVCGSLNEAHAKGIVHRDIKPSNIFVTSRGGLCDFVKVLDFGLAKQVSTAGSPASVTKSGVVFGTPRYIAPEALYGAADIDARSDLYNLGGVAYWLLTGRPPFDTDSSVDLIIDHVKNPPPAPSTVSETPVPPELEALIMRLLEKQPADRFQSARELELALRGLPQSGGWDFDRAKDWWSLHGLVEDEACFPLAGEEDSGPLRGIEGIAIEPAEA